MAEFHTYLTHDSPALAESDPEKQSVVDGVKAQVRGGGRRRRGGRGAASRLGGLAESGSGFVQAGVGAPLPASPQCLPSSRCSACLHQPPTHHLSASAANPIVRPPASQTHTHLQVCECLILFMERNEEEFAKFLQTFTQDVWTQLMKVSQAPGQVGGGRGRVGMAVCRTLLHVVGCCFFPMAYWRGTGEWCAALQHTLGPLPHPTPPSQDNLAMHAINFLTAVSRSVHYKLFEGADTLRQICESIVIPNLRMREDMVRREGWRPLLG